MNAGILKRLFPRALLSLVLSFSAISFALPTPAHADITFTFTGGGWGHGIGMSQWGARGYALQGKSYDWILAHYYQGSKLVTKPSQTVKVNLDKSAKARASWWIQSATDTTLTVIDATETDVRIGLDPTKTYWITTSGGNTRVHSDATYLDGSSTKHKPGTVLKTFSGASYATSGGRVRMVGTSGPFDHRGVAWRGTIRFFPSGDTASRAINYVSLENYLYGVVPRESPSSWPAEALKAQAVAARSYAYQSAVDGDTLYCTTMSQVYNGHSRPGETHEAASTNSAVNATAGKLVWYGSETKPVKTFFFSCSGGHTANIEDVWLASAPKPYYKGVSDPDSASPYYKWTVGPLTSTDISAKIRSKVGSSYSAPSPYKITGMSLERASSGFTRYVTVRWSNGSSYKIKGDSVRSALGLRSTKFGVKASNVNYWEPYQQSNPKLAWYGKWVPAHSKSQSGGSHRYTDVARSQVSGSFTGTGFRWVGNRAPNYGMAYVHLDGKRVATVDLYSSTTRSKQQLYAIGGLRRGAHTLKIVASSSKNRRSRGHYVGVDRIDVRNGILDQAITPISRMQQDNANVAWLGPWTTLLTDVVSGGSHIYSYDSSSAVRIDFYGSGISWVGSRSPAYGTARVTIDGVSQDVVVTSDQTLRQQVIWSKSGLDTSRRHTLTITPLGVGGTSAYVSVDRLDVTGGWLLPPALPTVALQENSPYVTTSGTWNAGSSTSLSAGRHIFSTQAGATASLRFDGTSITWLGTKGPNYGKAAVWLDGTKVGVVDLYSASKGYKQTIFSKTGLPCRPHVLTIEVLGQKRTGSSGYYVSLDALRLNGRATAP